jgi:flagellum-specific peptidoglycan hydrolase FlgJ
MANHKFFKTVIILVGFFFISCGSSRKVLNNQPVMISKENSSKDLINPKKNKQIKKINKSPKKELTNDEKIKNYIDKFSRIAEVEMNKHGIPASITLAQGILESGAGEGRLALIGNNHFGIKCHQQWKGEKMYHDDDKKGECFRVYKDASISYRDHSEFLNTRTRYDFLFELKKNNYKDWAKGLKKAGYATDPKYPDKLISLIERYDLYKFDNKNKSNKKKAELSFTIEHLVEKGDTLYSISKKYNVSIEYLIKNNNIKGSKINLGQTLIIQ